MRKLRFSMKAMMLLLTVAIVLFSILADRVHRQHTATLKILNSGGEAFFLSGFPQNGARATDGEYFSHWYRSLQTIVLHPTDEHSTKSLLEVAAKLPRLTNVTILPDCSKNTGSNGVPPTTAPINFESVNSVTNDDIESIAELLPNIERLIIAPASCTPDKVRWLKSQVTSMKSGTIMWREDDKSIRAIEWD